MPDPKKIVDDVIEKVKPVRTYDDPHTPGPPPAPPSPPSPPTP